MIISLLSANPIQEEVLKQLLSKKLEAVNNLQMAVARNKSDIIVYPVDYPSSISAFLRAISVSDYAVYVLGDSVSAIDAEIAVAIENSSLAGGKVLTLPGADVASFDGFFSKYRVSSFDRINPGDAAVFEEVKPVHHDVYVSIDKHFIVKGIGNVILGFVLSGAVNKGDRMFLLPSLKEVAVKSIQVMDEDVASAGRGSHVGLALNNVSETDMANNYAISSSKETADKFPCVFSKSEFYKADPYSSNILSSTIRGKSFNVKLTQAAGSHEITLSKPVIKPDGRQIIADSSLSVGKNRIVGNFEIN